MTAHSPRVGLVGGLGPESTIDYYRRVLEGWARAQPGTSPGIVIDSLDVQRGLWLVEHDRAGLITYVADSLARLAGAGATFAALAANTPHIVFDELAARSPVPLLSIVEVCAKEAARRGMRRVLVLGTRFTMGASFYPTVFARRGITVVVPDESERLWLHERYVGELLAGDFRDETRRAVISLVERLGARERIDGVVLGGTELPLLLGEGSVAGFPVLDTTALHVAAIVDRLRAEAGHVARLRAVLAASEPLLRAIGAEASARRPAPGKWSPREVIGHLVDSASNNHQRFVRATSQDDLVFPGYAQDEWVSLQRYQDTSWSELLDLWLSFNRQIARVMAAIPAPVRARPRARHNLDEIAWQLVPRSEPATLDYFMADYVGHLEHHLRQVLGADWEERGA